MKEIILENQAVGKQFVRRRDGKPTLSCGIIRSHKLKHLAGVRYKKIKIILGD